VGWPEAMSGNGRPAGDQGDGAVRRAQHGSDVRERRGLCQSAQSQREYAFRQIRQRGLGRVGQARVWRPVGEATGSDQFSGKIGQVAKSDKLQNRTSCKIGQVLKWRKRTSSVRLGRTGRGGGGPRLG
jgi:hypothetical protein